MNRVASIDIGTNSVLLLIAEREGHQLVALEERATITRLGEGVNKTRKLLPAACERTLACLKQYAAVCRRCAVERIVAVGTSAMRDAIGGEQFTARAAAVLGTSPHVASGAEEAELTFAGGLSGLPLQEAVVLFDVGGGSTEVIIGDVGTGGVRSIRTKHSLDIGSVRLFERFLRADPPSNDELEALASVVRGKLDELPTAPIAKTVVGVAGTVTTLSTIQQGLVSYVPHRVHGAILNNHQVNETLGRLAHSTIAQRKQIPGLSAKRADVIVAGAVIVRELMTWAQADHLVVSHRGVRWGLAERELLGAGS